MYGFGPDSEFWLKLFLLLGGFLLLVYIFNSIMRKILNVKKKKLFSYNHLNDKHKKIDWTIRSIFIISIIFSYFYTITRDPMETVWYLEVWFLSFVFLTISELVRAYMEWKYVKNENDYLFTISELIFVVVAAYCMFTTDFFGLFEIDLL
ncbi:protein of unknown function [Oceanobacillus limi]|uniref:DUF4181 domain-containing protein n=1 Tax=Oceanobacillus limi TaxID=930131 RepID=A0A1I0GK98_9BACI|nr:DUF4181 domain-containing protein [Oceanobacillus limi]SET71420.1 protein of unknown function [Oceanobacillus limi]